jgi:LPS-assembly protein
VPPGSPGAGIATEKPASPAPPVAPGTTGEPPAGEIRIKADTQGGEPGHSWARGFVDVRVGPMRIQADQGDIYEVTKEDGSKGKNAVFVGNVVFMRDEERLAGDRLSVDLDSGKGTFENASGYLKPGVVVEARIIERVDADTYRIKGGRFSSCLQPNPRWGFSAGSARIEVDDKVVAKNVLFRVKSVPAFYLPYFVYPIQEDQRSTGLLFPHFGYSGFRGFNIGSGFFWAMNRSFDQTFYVDNYSKFGWGFGHEFRYRLDAPSRVDFRTYVFNRDGADTLDYDVDWSGVQALPGGFRANVSVRRYSDTLFQERFQDSLNLASSRTERSQFSLQRSVGFFNAALSAEDNRTFFSDQERVNKRLPSFRLSSPNKKLGHTGLVFGFDSRAEALKRGNEKLVNEWSRIHLSPSLAFPVALSYLQVTPRVEVDYTRYGASVQAGVADGPALDRRFAESSIELQGPTFARIFNNPGGFYSDKFKHVIGPEVTWRYRTRIDDFKLIPKFDGIDQQLGTNQIDYALVQRLYARRPGGGGKVQPYEFVTWRIQQTYYVQIRDAQNEFDPNYSSGSFGPGGRPDHNSPLRSNLKVRPTPNLGGTFDLEYDVNFKQLRTLSIGGNVRGERASLTGNWSRALVLDEDPLKRDPTRDFIRGAASLAVLPKRLTLDGSVDYDILRKTLVQASARARWDVQCCGFIAELRHYDYNSRQENQFRFSLELANLGSLGNFLDGDQVGGARNGSRR